MTLKLFLYKACLIRLDVLLQVNAGSESSFIYLDLTFINSCLGSRILRSKLKGEDCQGGKKIPNVQSEVMVPRENSLRTCEEETFRGTSFNQEPILIWVTLDCAIKDNFSSITVCYSQAVLSVLSQTHQTQYIMDVVVELRGNEQEEH